MNFEIENGETYIASTYEFLNLECGNWKLKLNYYKNIIHEADSTFQKQNIFWIQHYIEAI